MKDGKKKKSLHNKEEREHNKLILLVLESQSQDKNNCDIKSRLSHRLARRNQSNPHDSRQTLSAPEIEACLLYGRTVPLYAQTAPAGINCVHSFRTWSRVWFQSGRPGMRNGMLRDAGSSHDRQTLGGNNLGGKKNSVDFGTGNQSTGESVCVGGGGWEGSGIVKAASEQNALDGQRREGEF
ncbi:hypothetical protein PoB_005012200 [Plakobranchus ocellatus]|uniref:Uncharacterized protein n=1 Tax=Plakobranchus ocellatus TaxID=259542 RepID=A0AAV4BWW0_9GAST|nr:hypothetical protein PoB_005012200 [Plakobranchus ocellatus]